MSDTPAKDRLKPLFLINPGTISARDIRRAEKLTGICIVECAEPEAARFLEPPIDAELDTQARAALSLMRVITRETNSQGSIHPNDSFSRGTLLKTFVDSLLYEPKPQTVPHIKTVKK